MCAITSVFVNPHVIHACIFKQCDPGPNNVLLQMIAFRLEL